MDIEIWRDRNGNPLKFQWGDHVRRNDQEEDIFTRGFITSYTEADDGSIFYSFNRDNVYHRRVAENLLELSPERRVQYSAVGYTKDGNYVNVPMWGDWMDIRSEGHETIEAATEAASKLFGQDERVAVVEIRESVQDIPGRPWRIGRSVATVNRSDVNA
jgi:hypothetical protein